MKLQGTSFELLTDPVFRRLWPSIELSFLGLFVHAVAGAWLMASLTTSATPVALIQTAQAMPIALFSLLAGTIADTYDKRRIMLVAILVAMLASIALTVLSALHALEPWSLLLLIFIVGTGVAIFTPSWQASLGDIVSRDRLSMAVSLHSIGANAMRTLGPSLGGVLVATFGAATAFMVGAASYLPATVVLLMWRPVRVSADDVGETREAFWSAVYTGISYLSVSPHVQSLLLRVFLYSVGAASVLALLPMVSKDQLGLDASGYGLLFGGFGAGAIIGGLAQLRLCRRFATETVLRGAFLVHMMAIIVMAFSTTLLPALLASVLCGSCWLTSHSLQNSHLQLSTPRWIAGRIVAMFLTAAFTGVALGGYLWGVLADSFGLPVSLCASALLMLVTFIVALRLPLTDISYLSLEPLADAGEPAVQVRANCKLGPVHVQLDHVIDAGSEAEFKQLMNRRRRHLTRIGARQWTLMRNLEAPEHWSEHFQVGTWDGYQRMMKRRTAETVRLREEIRAIQTAGREPKVTVLCQSRVDAKVIEPVLRP